jgi:hypothetical protein
LRIAAFDNLVEPGDQRGGSRHQTYLKTAASAVSAI